MYSRQLCHSRVHSLARNLSSVMAIFIDQHEVSTHCEATSSTGSNIRKHCWNPDLYFQIFPHHSLALVRGRLKKGIQTMTSGLSKMERKSSPTYPRASTAWKGTCKQHKTCLRLATPIFMPPPGYAQTTLIS